MLASFVLLAALSSAKLRILREGVDLLRNVSEGEVEDIRERFPDIPRRPPASADDDANSAAKPEGDIPLRKLPRPGFGRDRLRRPRRSLDELPPLKRRILDGAELVPRKLIGDFDGPLRLRRPDTLRKSEDDEDVKPKTDDDIPLKHRKADDTDDNAALKKVANADDDQDNKDSEVEPKKGAANDHGDQDKNDEDGKKDDDDDKKDDGAGKKGDEQDKEDEGGEKKGDDQEKEDDGAGKNGEDAKVESARKVKGKGIAFDPGNDFEESPSAQSPKGRSAVVILVLAVVVAVFAGGKLWRDKRNVRKRMEIAASEEPLLESEEFF